MLIWEAESHRQSALFSCRLGWLENQKDFPFMQLAQIPL